jgi:hypothetical protein
MTARYITRYRYGDPVRPSGLIVEDGDGEAYVCGRDGLVCRLCGAYGPEALLPRLLGLGWVPCPPAPTATLAALRRRLAPSPDGCAALD